MPSPRQIEPARPMKWLQREGQNMLSITIIQEPLDVLFLRINFQQRNCSNDKFQRRIWSLVYQFAGVLENERKGIFLTKEGGGWTSTPLDPLDIDSPILACSRLSDREDGAKRYEQKQKPARPILLLLLSRSIKLWNAVHIMSSMGRIT